MKKIVLILSVSIMLFGCANQQQAYRPTSADDPTNKCFNVFKDDPRLLVLNPKIGPVTRPADATIEMMASKEKPNDAEKEALSLWASARKSCVDLGRSFRAQYAPSGWANAFESMQSGILKTIADLYAGDITFGQFIAERARIADLGSQAMNSSAERDNDRRNEQSRYEQDRRNADMQKYLQNQRDNRPVTTNCYRIGNSMSCTSR